MIDNFLNIIFLIMAFIFFMTMAIILYNILFKKRNDYYSNNKPSECQNRGYFPKGNGNNIHAYSSNGNTNCSGVSCEHSGAFENSEYIDAEKMAGQALNIFKKNPDKFFEMAGNLNPEKMTDTQYGIFKAMNDEKKYNKRSLPNPSFSIDEDLKLPARKHKLLK